MRLLVHNAEKFVTPESNTQAKNLLAQARRLLAWIPIDESKASEMDFNALFTVSRKKESTEITGQQAQIVQEWDKQIKRNYAEATLLAEKVLRVE